MFWKKKTLNDAEKGYAKKLIKVLQRSYQSKEVLKLYSTLRQKHKDSDFWGISGEYSSIINDLEVLFDLEEKDNKYRVWLLTEKYTKLNDLELKQILILRLKMFLDDANTEAIYKVHSKGLRYNDEVIKVEKIYIEYPFVLYKSLEEELRYYASISLHVGIAMSGKVYKLSKRQSKIISDTGDYRKVIMPYCEYPFKEEELD